MWTDTDISAMKMQLPSRCDGHVSPLVPSLYGTEDTDNILLPDLSFTLQICP